MTAYAHPPKEIAVSFCTACGLVRTAEHVNRENEIPQRFCSRCGGALAVAVYGHMRDLKPI